MIYDIQRASVWKRLSALLLDVILLAICASGFAFALSKIVGYDVKYERYSSILNEIQTKYDVDFTVNESTYNEFSDEVKERYDAAYKEINGNSEAIGLLNLVINLSLIIVSVGILLSYLLLEFFIPLFVFKNGRTVGKKIFGLALIRDNGVKINGVVLFIRTILGKFAIETMIAAYIVIMFIFGRADLIMIILLFLIPVVNVVLLFATHNRTPIHDLLAKTVEVDFESQMIFDTEEEMIEFKKKAHSEAAENARY